MKGASNNVSVGVLIECTNRLMLLAKMGEVRAVSALVNFTVKFSSIGAALRQSPLYDQGAAMHPPPRTYYCHRCEGLLLRAAQSTANLFALIFTDDE
ncbi:hypothetical protein PQQ96_33230 [Paraburkholderia sediminicola]|uniref:hypothetical protein n=1 Tax=Paraburkholderia sediminicola TaxID=458836 RepID=UPI0038BA8C4C